MTPISPNEFAKLAARMKANEEALEHCPRHQFEMRYLYGDGNPPRWVCRNCTGIIDGVTHQWYARGMRDAVFTGRPLEDTPPGWHEG